MFRALIELFIFQVRHQNLMFRALGAIEVVEVVAVDEVMSVGINTEGARQHLYPGVCVPIYPEVCVPVYPGVCVPIYPGVCVPIYPGVCVPI
jgi:hypothetical protein